MSREIEVKRIAAVLRRTNWPVDGHGKYNAVPADQVNDAASRLYSAGIRTEAAAPPDTGLAGLREQLAAIEHEQWIAWSQDLASKELLSGGRLARWADLWVPYADLSDEMKDHDRKWADKVLVALAAQVPEPSLDAAMELLERARPAMKMAIGMAKSEPEPREWRIRFLSMLRDDIDAMLRLRATTEAPE